MGQDTEVDRVVLDGYDSRDLASKILAADRLLDHADLDDEHRPAIMGTLVRAARSLATRVVVADQHADRPDGEPARLPASGAEATAGG